MGIETLACPECSAGAKMGLPQSATVKSVTTERREKPDAERVKVRATACPNDHRFFVTFEF
ncbi:transcriptional regulator Brz [Halorhabdus rudnickae]|uniref:transcriptional regulator Brz n=1 Tax=Halorhabdus rudnickae TaxID=1775544 RepID=UPI0010830786|nr:transcriptional regulator Brz [Halorhabdus rudnickae]